MRRGRTTRCVAVATALAAGALGGCADAAELRPPDLETRVEVDTVELRAVKKEIGVRPCPSPGAGGSELPEVTLQCLGGGRATTLSEVEGPAVVSLWASWCVSCPEELPLFQRLSDEAGDRLSVIGVDYQDVQPGKALALLELTEAVFPQLADPGGELAEHYRLTGLPAVLLVDGSGAVHFQRGRIDTYAQLRELVADHTGVAVPAG